MAGRNLRDTLRLGSEDWIEFPCSPCEKDGKKVASIKHCVEHMRSLPEVTRLWKTRELKSNRRDQNCLSRDVTSTVGAERKQFIPDVVKSSPIAEEMSKLDSSMEQLLAQLNKLKHDKQDRLKQLQIEKTDILKEIGDLRKKINDHLDRMEKTLVSELESMHSRKMQSINQSVETFNNMTSSVAKSWQTLQEARNINDTELFVQIKQGKENLREHEIKMKQFTFEEDMRSVKLFPSSLKDVLFSEKDNIFGRISEITIPKSIEHFGDFIVRQQSDKNTCDITDVCLTTNGSIFCTDWKNNTLKKLDRSYNLIEHLNISAPVCLCEVNNTQLAVTLIDDKKVQFVFQQPLKLGRCFAVGDYCRGIDCHDGKLYVCCGGGESAGPGHVEVYDINGGLLRSFYKGLSKPFYIKAACDCDLFIGDNLGSSLKLFKVNTHFFSLSEIHIKTLTDVRKFCRIGKSQLCIPGLESNKIVLISDDGEEQKELLTVKDGIEKPCIVFFNEKQSQLVVGFDNSDVIKVYHVIF